MSCRPCPFERRSSREWSQEAREHALKGRGSWTGSRGYFRLRRSGCLPSLLCSGPESSPGTHAHQASWPAPPPPPTPRAPAGGKWLDPWVWEAGVSCSHRHSLPSRPCPAPLLHPVSPRNEAETAHSVQRPMLRAKGHQTTCPERQAPGDMVGEV